MTSQQLAENTGIGQSTIIRFSRKLGYESFRELLADISGTPVHQVIEEEINIAEDSAATLKKVVQQVQNIVELTNEANDAEALLQAAERLKQASEIILYGVGSSGLFAEYLTNQLIKLGFLCRYSESAHSIYMMIEHASSEAVVFLISETGKSREVLKAARLAKEKGICVMAMSRGRKNPLQEYADYILKTVSFETVTRLNVTTMRCSQLFLIDALYLLIMKSDFSHYDHEVETAESLIQN